MKKAHVSCSLKDAQELISQSWSSSGRQLNVQGQRQSTGQPRGAVKIKSGVVAIKKQDLGGQAMRPVKEEVPTLRCATDIKTAAFMFFHNHLSVYACVLICE